MEPIAATSTDASVIHGASIGRDPWPLDDLLISADTDVLDDAAWRSMLPDMDDSALMAALSAATMKPDEAEDPDPDPDRETDTDSNPAPESADDASPRVKKKKRRRRQKEELDALRAQVREMETRLQYLRSASGTTHALRLALNGASPSPDVVSGKTDEVLAQMTVSLSTTRHWRPIAHLRKQQTRRAVMENIQLRAILEGQNTMARNLQTLMRQRPPVTPLDLSPYLGARSSMRIDADAEAQLFTSIGRDLNALHAQTDAVLQATGMANHTEEFNSDPSIRVGASGFFLEHCKIRAWPLSVNTVQRTAWSVLKRPTLAVETGVYICHHASPDTINAKIVQTLPLSSLPGRRSGTGTSDQARETETVVTIRLVVKRFVEQDRVVFVWETLVDTAGALTIRVREQAWCVIQTVEAVGGGGHRDPAMRSVGHTCIRMSPEMVTNGGDATTRTGQAAAADTGETGVTELSRLVVDSWETNLNVLHSVMETVWAEERTACA